MNDEHDLQLVIHDLYDALRDAQQIELVPDTSLEIAYNIWVAIHYPDPDNNDKGDDTTQP